MPSDSPNVFLSHNSKDKPAVRELRDRLTAEGITVWFDEDELRPGIPWQPSLEEGIKSSSSIAVLVGKDGLRPWEDEETQAALILAVNDKRPVIPVLLPGAGKKPELPMFLANRTWVDLRSGPSDDNVARLIWGITGKKPRKLKQQSTHCKIAPTRLHHGAAHLVGRETELTALDKAWKSTSTHVMTIVAWGGVGKTSLVIEWMNRQSAANWPGFARVFDWPFYSQGTTNQTAASADAFTAKALEFFGDKEMAQSPTSPWDKGARLAQLIAEQPTLLVLDGLEPLPHPPGPVAGKLKDPAVESLLKGLAQQNPGLCIVTTREKVIDLAPHRESTAPVWNLEHLSAEAGAAVLHRAGATRAGAAEIKEDDPELQTTSKEVKGHALTLHLLGTYLELAHHGDIRKRDTIDFESAAAQNKSNPDDRYGHAFKVMAAYEAWLTEGGPAGARQLAVLRLTGLFDRPADAGCITALRTGPAIKGLTEPLVDLTDVAWNITLKRLADCGLIAPQSATPDSQSPIDAHPLLREYFATQLRDTNPTAHRAAHERLYHHLKDSTEHQPDTLEGLHPLYQAIAHGCQAGLQQEACAEVYRDRILRGEQNYSTFTLGAVGADLGAIACFFDQPWTRISPTLPEPVHAWLLNEAAFGLRSLGRLIEALEPMRTAVEWTRQHKHWKHAAAGAGNLSELELTLGDMPGAVRDAEQSVTFADRSGDTLMRSARLATLANALHNAARSADALSRFSKAEAMQAEGQPKHPLLYSLRGFNYCDLLLAEPERAAWQAQLATATLQPVGDANDVLNVESTDGPNILQRCRDVEQRATQALEWSATKEFLLDIALGHLTLGRAALYRAVLTDSMSDRVEAIETARQQLTVAVDGLRRADQQDFIPRGLLTRAWLRVMENDPAGTRVDLDEAWHIAERGPMPLHMADIELHRARLFRDPAALARAAALIKKHAYARRNEELADAQQAVKSWTQQTNN